GRLRREYMSSYGSAVIGQTPATPEGIGVIGVVGVVGVNGGITGSGAGGVGGSGAIGTMGEGTGGGTFGSSDITSNNPPTPYPCQKTPLPSILLFILHPSSFILHPLPCP